MGWSWVDSFYMTVITISTVGFREVETLDEAGKIFTSFLIFSSLGTVAFAASSIASYILGGTYREELKKSKIMKEINKLENHIIICGFGRVGKQAAAEFKLHQRDFLIIESNKDLIESSKLEQSDLLFLEGNATNDEILMAANIEKASAIILALPNDSDNLFIVVSAREMNKKLKIISRASKQTSVRKLKIAGANNVIMPDVVGGAHMASLVANPDVMEFIDSIRVTGDSKVNLEEIECEDLQEKLKFSTIGDLLEQHVSGCNIVGYKAPDGEIIINPEKHQIIEPSSKLFVLGKPEQIERLNTFMGKD